MLDFGLKELFSATAIVLTFIAFIPYIRSILNGQTKPHVFSWLIWGSTTFIVFLAQLSDDAGVGAWPIGISGLITLYVAFLAYRIKTDISITGSDWLFLTLAFSALPFWYFTQDPVWAVIILTVVDLLGFGPTYRKAYHQPYEENIWFYSLFAMRNSLVVLALEHYSITTALFPASIACASLLLILLILFRRQRLKPGSI